MNTDADECLGIVFTHISHADKTTNTPLAPSTGSLFGHHDTNINFLAKCRCEAIHIVGLVFICRAISPLEVQINLDFSLLGNALRRNFKIQISLVAIVERTRINIGIYHIAIKTALNDWLLGSDARTIGNAHIRLDWLAKLSHGIGCRSGKNGQIVLGDVVSFHSTLYRERSEVTAREVGVLAIFHNPATINTGIASKRNDVEFLRLHELEANPQFGLITGNGVGLIQLDFVPTSHRSRKGSRSNTLAILAGSNPTSEFIWISRSIGQTCTNSRDLKSLICTKHRSWDADDLSYRGICSTLTSNGARCFSSNLSVAIAQEQLSFSLGGIKRKKGDGTSHQRE